MAAGRRLRGKAPFDGRGAWQRKLLSAANLALVNMKGAKMMMRLNPEGLVLAGLVALLTLNARFVPAADEAPQGVSQSKRSDQDAIQGTWKVVRIESRDAERRTSLRKVQMQCRFENNRVKVTFSTVRNEKGLVEDATFKLDSTKNPRAIDLTLVRGFFGDEKPGVVSLGIYALDNDNSTLRLCYSLDRARRPRGFVLDDDDTVILHLERVKE
jgi:uncharacterized protein (TIGR03067 family)